MIDQEKKSPGVFIWVTHDLINLKELKEILCKLNVKNLVKFKQEPCILHIACKTLRDAQELINKSKLAGFKIAGIIATGRRFVVELMNTEKLEFPVMDNGKILVSDDFLKVIVKKSNENLKKSWEKIERLGKLL
ncbi:MAG: hypothetical protein WC238_05755 [Parcubacteria group bacterium]|jgi:tRNA wybutosine-synthesizing protein 3